MLNKNSFNKLMQMAASVKKNRAVCKSLHSTTHWKLKLAIVFIYIQISNSQTQHILTSRSDSCVTKCNSTTAFFKAF